MARILLAARETFEFHSTNPLDLAEVLASEGHEVIVAAPFSDVALQGNAGRGFRPLRLPPFRDGDNISFWWEAIAAAERIRPDVFIGVNPVGLVAADFAKGCGFAKRAVYYGLELLLPEEVPRSLSVLWTAERLRHLDLAITTSPERAGEMQSRFGLSRSPVPVANAAMRSFGPDDSELRKLAAAAGCRAREIVVYVGGIGRTLRLVEAARASRLWKRDAALMLVTFGGSADDNANLDTEVRASEGRAFRLAPVSGSREAVIRLVAGADAGLVLYDHRADQSRNVALATPNKLFDYLAGGLPIIASDTPGLQRFVQEQGLGVTCDPRDPMAISAAVENVLNHREAYGTRARELFATRYNYTAQSAPVRAAMAGWAPE